jgi:peptidyl-Asp metalloendopeptidase
MALTRWCCALGVVLVVASWVPGIGAQSIPDLISSLPAARPVTKRAVRARRARKARVNVAALDAPALRLQLFDDIVHRVVRTKVDRLDSHRFVWHGTDEDGGAVTLAVVDNVVAGAIYTDGRAFELTVDADGDYEVAELDPAAFPTEDPPLDVPRSGAGVAAALPAAQGVSADGVPQIDVMVLWTPAARNAVGGTVAAVQSLVTLAVANANLSYANSQVGATLRLVYSGEVNLSESDISTDLTRLSTADGFIDQVQSLRSQYGADVVTLIGNGYAGAGACGVGFIMSTTSTSFAPWAYNVVDQSCAATYLSYAHEVGHNEGLQHDPANAGSAPSFPYAYGYQDPSGAFRTVMAYGSAVRIPFFSSPLVSYAGLLTGTSAQDNARALRNNVATVASFMGSPSGGTSCSYALSPNALSFSASGGSAQVNVTTAAGCAWTATSNASWVVVGPGGTGSGSVTLTATSNSGNNRSTSAVIAGLNASVSEGGTRPHGKR